MTKLNIHQKFLLAQKELKPLSMSGKNTFHKYKYTTSSDVLEPVREVCNEYGLTLRASTLTSRIEPGKAEVMVELRVVDCDSGESYITTAPGYGEDYSHKDNKVTGDKAVYKAITGATKYAVRLMFCLPSEDDPEKTDKRKKQSLPFSSEDEAILWAMRELEWEKNQAEKALQETVPDVKGGKSVPFYNHIKGLIREKKVEDMNNVLVDKIKSYSVGTNLEKVGESNDT